MCCYEIVASDTLAFIWLVPNVGAVLIVKPGCVHLVPGPRTHRTVLMTTNFELPDNGPCDFDWFSESRSRLNQAAHQPLFEQPIVNVGRDPQVPMTTLGILDIK